LPSEAARFSRPVGARDRRVFATLALVAACGTVAGVFLFGHGGGARASGCLSYDAPGVLGGGTWHLCGPDAVAFCRAHRGESKSLAAKCDQL
jgi:hypothetical protein